MIPDPGEKNPRVWALCAKAAWGRGHCQAGEPLPMELQLQSQEMQFETLPTAWGMLEQPLGVRGGRGRAAALCSEIHRAQLGENSPNILPSNICSLLGS